MAGLGEGLGFQVPEIIMVRWHDPENRKQVVNSTSCVNDSGNTLLICTVLLYNLPGMDPT